MRYSQKFYQLIDEFDYWVIEANELISNKEVYGHIAYEKFADKCDKLEKDIMALDEFEWYNIEPMQEMRGRLWILFDFKHKLTQEIVRGKDEFNYE